ncbi:TPA: winged helix-turn-helix transcriptional regulator, partial [Clostridioides difficile]
LERDGLIKRISYPTIPPKVEYLSTKRGKSLESILLELCNWGKQYMR